MAFIQEEAVYQGDRKGKRVVQQKLMMLSPQPSQGMHLRPDSCLLNT